MLSWRAIPSHPIATAHSGAQILLVAQRLQTKQCATARWFNVARRGSMAVPHAAFLPVHRKRCRQGPVAIVGALGSQRAVAAEPSGMPPDDTLLASTAHSQSVERADGDMERTAAAVGDAQTSPHVAIVNFSMQQYYFPASVLTIRTTGDPESVLH